MRDIKADCLLRIFPSRRIHALVCCVVLLGFTAGCSLFNPRPANSLSQPEVRDVPFQARSARDLAPRKRLMVLPFLNNAAARSERVSQVARDAFVRSLRKTDDFVIVSNTDFPKDIAGYLKNGQYDLEAMGKIGGGMGLSAIVEGRIIEIRARRISDEVGIVRQVRARIEATVQLRMVNTKNGTIMLDETRTAEVEDSTTRVAERAINDRYLEEDPKLIDAVVTKAFYGMVQRISQSVEKLNWEGRVALVKGDRIYLNAGRLSGLQVGDILKVTEEGEEVYDPESGSLIGTVPGRLKGTIEVVSYFGKDGSISVIHSGSGFRENDKVELY